MQISELRVIATSSEHVDLVLVHCQSETITCLGQVAVAPLLPIAGLETIGSHGLGLGESYCSGSVLIGAKEGVEGIFKHACAMDVAFGIGVEDLLLLLVLRPHHPPPTPLQVVVASRLQDLPLFILSLDLHLIL